MSTNRDELSHARDIRQMPVIKAPAMNRRASRAAFVYTKRRFL
ncbi:hypothetical protein BURPSPAST_AC0043 [Burkholderia pseudomallei Pasteur 52237]|nr:hypothetical protein BURPSPAST_AC0043 [Burkholderia pseudomallei Pasteur 52237]